MWPNFTKECRADIDKILRSGKLTAYRATKQWGLGPADWSHAYAFEREIERKFKVKHAVAVNSGTAALHASLVALDVRGQEVITSPFTFSATAAAILMAGGRPVFVDVSKDTFCLEPKEVKRAITKKTAAILPVHLFGYFPGLADLHGLGLPIIEDACQAVGASRSGVYAGTVGLAGAYSFNGSKNVPAGEGGCLVTNDSDIAEKARRLCNHGENFDSQEVGLNYRMTELHACLARHGLRELESRNQRRRELVRLFHNTAARDEWTQVSKGQMKSDHVYYVLPLSMTYGKATRADIIKYCAKRGLPLQAGYTTPLHKLKAFRKYAPKPLPVTEDIDKRLCLVTTLTPGRSDAYAKRMGEILYRATRK